MQPVEDPLGVLFLDRVVHLVEVPNLEVTTLDVPEVRAEVVVNVLLVAVAGRTGQGLLRLDPPKEEVAALLIGQHVAAGHGGVVDLPGLLAVNLDHTSTPSPAPPSPSAADPAGGFAWLGPGPADRVVVRRRGTARRGHPVPAGAGCWRRAHRRPVHAGAGERPDAGGGLERPR